MKSAYIALGGNMSNPKQAFIKALNAIRREGNQIISVSGLWQSPSWPYGQGHPDYLNAVAEIKTNEAPLGLLVILQGLEVEAGRQRTTPNAPRPLDLDIIDFEGRVIEEPGLSLPHPRMLTRGFVLFPLVQIAPNWIDPKSQTDIDYYISRLPLADVEPMVYKGRFWDQ